MGDCIFCGQHTESEGQNGINYYLYCNNCGRYYITHKALMVLGNELRLKHQDKMHIISGYLREMTELGLETELITCDNYGSLFNNSLIPKTLGEKLDKLLLYVYRHSEYLEMEVVIPTDQYAISYSKNGVELLKLIKILSEQGLIEYKQGVVNGSSGNSIIALNVILNYKGIQRAESLQKEVINNKQAFVAMWFSDEMLNIYNKYISKAIIDSGYEPLIISNKEHLGKICDEIIAQIRKSKFLVADFTGQRGGVYYEAGFAHGLGIPVIWTCRRDWFDGVIQRNVIIHSEDGTEQPTIISEKVGVHFDIRQYNFIVWETESELYERLKNRILATIV